MEYVYTVLLLVQTHFQFSLFLWLPPSPPYTNASEINSAKHSLEQNYMNRHWQMSHWFSLLFHSNIEITQ
jgi:hypothetical protein